MSQYTPEPNFIQKGNPQSWEEFNALLRKEGGTIPISMPHVIKKNPDGNLEIVNEKQEFKLTRQEKNRLHGDAIMGVSRYFGKPKTER